MSKNVAVKKEDALPMTIAEQMEAEALAMRDNLQITSSKLSTLNKTYTLPDGTPIGDSIQLVILGYARVNTMYENAEYVKGQANPVVCSAKIDMRVGGDMIPNPNSIDKQSEACRTWKEPICPMNTFGSKGRGKRCKNEFVLITALPTDTKTMLLHIPPTATEDISKAMRMIIKEYGHPAKAIVTFKFNPTQTYPLPIITGADENPNAEDHFIARNDAMEDYLNS